MAHRGSFVAELAAAVVSDLFLCSILQLVVDIVYHHGRSAFRASNQPCQNAGASFVPRGMLTAGLQLQLNLLPQRRIHNGFMLSFDNESILTEAFPTLVSPLFELVVLDFTYVGLVVKNVFDRNRAERVPLFGPVTSPIQAVCYCPVTLSNSRLLKNQANQFGFFFVNLENLFTVFVFYVIVPQDSTAIPTTIEGPFGHAKLHVLCDLVAFQFIHGCHYL